MNRDLGFGPPPTGSAPACSSSATACSRSRATSSSTGSAPGSGSRASWWPGVGVHGDDVGKQRGPSSSCASCWARRRRVSSRKIHLHLTYRIPRGNGLWAYAWFCHPGCGGDRRRPLSGALLRPPWATGLQGWQWLSCSRACRPSWSASGPSSTSPTRPEHADLADARPTRRGSAETMTRERYRRGSARATRRCSPASGAASCGCCARSTS